MNRIIEYGINTIEECVSVERFLRNKGYTKQSITELKKYNNSTMVAGKWVHMNHKLSLYDILTISFDETESSEKIPPVNLPFPVVYEDEDIIVVNKPCNMPIHPSLNNYENTLGNAAAYYFGQRGENHIFRCINRLDRDTTGLTIIAKHFVSAGILYNQMKSRQIKREYLAIVEDGGLEDEGVIDAPIGRLDGSTIERCIDWDNGERAITNYRVIDRNGKYALVSFRLETGRTHQIRVHMKYMGHPLVGDCLYNPNSTIMSRQALHSRRIDFVHPITMEEMVFECEMPADMAEVWKI